MDNVLTNMFMFLIGAGSYMVLYAAFAIVYCRYYKHCTSICSKPQVEHR